MMDLVVAVLLLAATISVFFIGVLAGWWLALTDQHHSSKQVAEPRDGATEYRCAIAELDTIR
jgi:hypothetical protein